ncbi:MAG: DNA-directed RNA polymerase subunit alpha [Thermodesulfobacteriota bacterium]|nr:DNA-directed RNA polymerase subunit alpha [Thermodesulfobacteriota bacterium]
MYMNWQEIITPESIQVEAATPFYGKFVCEPLARGFGTTIGNALRRIIISSLHGAAITDVKIEDVMHEYSAIEGVLEDVSEIILNLKEVRLKVTDAEPRKINVEKSGEAIVTAGDFISGDGRVEVLNPEAHIATLSEGASLKMEMTVKAGKGYALAENNKDEEAPAGTMPIDAIFSPIRRVNYVVGNSRVKQRTDYDKLTLEVWTDGSVLPEDAIAFAAKILKEQLNVFINFDESAEPTHIRRKDDSQSKEFNENLYRSVNELELSVRSSNCLKNAEIDKIYQLVKKTEGDMLKTKNFGRKSLNEIKELLSEMGLSLGMDLEGFEPPEEDKNDKGE